MKKAGRETLEEKGGVLKRNIWIIWAEIQPLWLNQPIWKILKNMSQNGKSSPKFGVKIKNIWKHHLETY